MRVEFYYNEMNQEWCAELYDNNQKLVAYNKGKNHIELFGKLFYANRETLGIPFVRLENAIDFAKED